jgi:hypothetical protein
MKPSQSGLRKLPPLCQWHVTGVKIIKARQAIYASILAIAAIAPTFASTLCPNGQYVSGSTCTLCPDGSYIGGGQCTITPTGGYVGGTPRITPNGGYVSGSGQTSICPDGSYVSGRCEITPNGTYVGK